MTLQEFFRQHPKSALGFSGGVDSSYLLYAGISAGAEVRPYFIKTAFQPAFELEDAKRLCAQLGAELSIIELDALANPDVAKNPANRCYYCKTGLFGALQKRALEDGYTVLLDGTNASDEAGDRPGMQALSELHVLSPLRLCGLTKSQIRELSREAGLFTWDKPAYACLATRIPTGQRITNELLARVEGAEQALFSLGFTDFRVRVFHDAARVQLKPAQMQQALTRRSEILENMRPYFETVLLDLKGRYAWNNRKSGSFYRRSLQANARSTTRFYSSRKIPLRIWALRSSIITARCGRALPRSSTVRAKRRSRFSKSHRRCSITGRRLS